MGEYFSGTSLLLDTNVKIINKRYLLYLEEIKVLCFQFNPNSYCQQRSITNIILNWLKSISLRIKYFLDFNFKKRLRYDAIFKVW